MTILRWILIGGLAFGFLMLSVANWVPVPFRLPDGDLVNWPLPVLLGAAFVAGWLPTWLYHLGAKATWKRRLGKSGAADQRLTPAANETRGPLANPPSAASPAGLPPTFP